MNETQNSANSADTGLQSFKVDRALQITAVVVTLLTIALYDRVMALRPWSWLARGGLNTAVVVCAVTIHIVVFFAAGYLLLSWMRRRTASSTLTLAGLVLVLFISYPVIQDGPLAFFVGRSSSAGRLNPSAWHSIAYYLGLYAGFGAKIALALWINYLVYRLVRRHGIWAAMAVTVGIWGFYFGPMLHGPSLPQTILLCPATLALAALAWRPSSASLKAFVGFTAASFLVGVISGGLGSPTFTAFGLKRVTLVPFFMFSTGVVGAAVAAALPRRKDKPAEQAAAVA